MLAASQLLMLGAMYENGGNTTHRFLDGHPQMFVYPFESQLGTKLVNDNLSSVFPAKYRWPAFALDATPDQDYAAIIDEECRVRTRTPNVSKFRHFALDLSDDDRRLSYVRYVGKSERSRPGNVMAFFRATFDSWKNYRRSGQEKFYVGYSPILVVDADKILAELPDAHFLHVVRNPWSAYADTKKRPVPLSLADYVFGWTINQYFALLFREKFPNRLHIVRAEDVMSDPAGTLGQICTMLGLEPAASLREISWNRTLLDEVYPWGTIKHPSAQANRETAEELTEAEKGEVRERAWQYLDVFDYTSFLRG
jgi:hypothetical protein